MCKNILVKYKKRKGFTLLELLIAFSLMAIISGVIFTFFQINNKKINETEIKSALQFESRMVMDALTDNIMEAKSINQLEFIAPSTEKLISRVKLNLIKGNDKDTNPNPETVEFILKDTELIIKKSGTEKVVSNKVKYIKITNIDITKNVDELNKTTNTLSVEIMLEDKEILYKLQNEITLRNFGIQ